MLQRLMICGVLLYFAATIDQGLPIWISTPALPSCLSLLFVLMCLSLRGAELVVWTGAVGLAVDFLAGETPGAGVMTMATLGLLSAWRQHEHDSGWTLSDRLMGGLWLFLMLGVIQGIGIALRTTTVSLEVLATTLASRLAATYLLFVFVNLVWCGVRLCRRSSYQLENSCV